MRKIFSTAVVLASIAVLGLATAAIAGTVTRETFVVTGGESVVDDCRPSVTGNVTGTDTVAVHSVETAASFNQKGTSSGTGRIDWNDGSYTLVSWKTEFTFHASGDDTWTYHEAHK